MKKTLLLLFLTLTLTMPALAQIKPTVAIFGDSYSTFEGFIPKENAIWYKATKQKSTDVTSVEHTWWWQVIKEGGYKLGVTMPGRAPQSAIRVITTMTILTRAS